MLSLVIGGAASGKSEFAEQLACRSQATERIYVATLKPHDVESCERIAKHRDTRAGKGYITYECFGPLTSLFPHVSKESSVLVESLGTLFSGRITWDDSASIDAVADELVNEVAALSDLAGDVVVVTDEVAADGYLYDATTRHYQQTLGRLNLEIAKLADQVVEVTCGCVLYYKGVD